MSKNVVWTFLRGQWTLHQRRSNFVCRLEGYKTS